MFESNMMSNQKSEDVSRTGNFGDVSAPRSSTALVIPAGLLDRVSSLPGQPFTTERYQAWRVSPPSASA